MSTAAVTPRQQDALDAVRRHIDEHGYAPSVREVAAELDLASPSTAHRLLRILESKGRLVKQRVSKTREVYVVAP